MRHAGSLNLDGPRGGPGAPEPDFADALRDAVALLRRNLVAMVLVGLAFAAVAYALSQRIERQYRSGTQIMIERSAASPIEAEASTGAGAAVDAGYVDGQVLLLLSDDMLRTVVERAELLAEPSFQPRPPSLPRRLIAAAKAQLPAEWLPAAPAAEIPRDPVRGAVRRLSDSVAVRRIGDTNVVDIDVRAAAPELAQRIAATLAASYIDGRLAARGAEARRLSDWIDERAAELRAKLTEAEREATAYRIERGLIGEAGGGASLNEQQLTELNVQLIRARADLAQKRAAAEQAQAVLLGSDPGSLPEVQGSALVQALRATQLDLERRLQDVAQTGRGESPRLREVERQLDAVYAQIQDEILRIGQTLDNEVEALEARARLLAEAVETAGGESGQETLDAVRLRELDRMVEAYRQRYERYLASAGVASELETFSTSGTQVISSASLPLEPFYPPTKMFVILGFLVGVAAVLGTAMVRDTLRRDFRSADDIEAATGLRVLTALPRLQPREVGPRVIERQPFSPFSEGVALLRQSLLAHEPEMRAAQGAPVVLITSAEDHVGKTTVAASLGLSASTAGKRVLLVDGDLRLAGLSELHDMDGDPGLCEILGGREFLPDGSDDDSVLDVIPAGDLRGRQPSAYLDTAALGAFLARARRHYDLVIVDGPPVANLADCRILARECSAVAVVLDVARSTPDALRGAIRQLPARKLAGVVVNGVDLDDPSGNWSPGGIYTTALLRRPAAPVDPEPYAGAAARARVVSPRGALPEAKPSPEVV